ncbi:sulfite dehydrogenase [Granulosicoccus antarcticus]|nr:sulfite dehydrogenase [Granulosicoccus antarcticus]
MQNKRLYPAKTAQMRTDRRSFLQLGGLGLLGAGVAGVSDAAEPPSWSEAGGGFSNYGQPADTEQRTIRWISANPAVPGEGVSWTPLHELEGTITPNGLHFERHHNGVPSIDPDEWSLLVNASGERSLRYSLADLHRYPLQSRILFIECGGNSNTLWKPQPVQAAAGHLHGLVSGCEWTGVALSVLLQEAGISTQDKWLIADAMDASGVTVSLPIAKCLDDVLVALYQNGEALRPENGYPARLVVPGWEGIVNVKWLRSLSLSDVPLMSRFDTVSYTDLQKDGIAERMTFEMGVKSIITSPSVGQQLTTTGDYEVRGLAWSGAGRIQTVELSADGGRNWVPAHLQEPVLDRALTRFRLPWHWDGRAQVLMSRATDTAGARQPSRDELISAKGGNVYYHYNGICAWAVDVDGDISHVYA